jgi:hypothetical protein
MAQTEFSNELYLVVLPTISLANGKVEQILTLLPEKNFATVFFRDEVEQFVRMFKSREEFLVGGHVKSYDFEQEETESGRVIVRVTQNVG